MSAITDTLITAAGSGGALVTLIAALRAWFARGRVRRVVIELKSGEKTVVVNAENVDAEVVARILSDIQVDIAEKTVPDEPATELRAQ